MDSWNSSRIPKVVRTFRSILGPDKDNIRVCDIFYNTWEVNLFDGYVYLKDPKGNTIHLCLNDYRNDGPYLSGVHSLFEFYGIHNIRFFYKASKEFSIKITNESNIEIHYPDYLTGPFMVEESDSDEESES
ncbi:hypothetical protein SESBI_22128 [Sesbania bispinosa]|nr:hypothetical protein SESBI_22128 [Sesbania bispinosa]